MADRPRSPRELNRATLARQALLERARGSVAEVIGRLAGLQAQAADPPYVALWSRRQGQTIAELEEALTSRAVVKATLMRSTLHLVAATDYAAFDTATAGARIANWRATARRAGVSLDDVHERLLDFCDEPRTVAEIETWLDTAATDIVAAAPAGVRNTAFRAASAGGGLVHVPPSGLFGTRDRPSYIAARAWLGGLTSPSPDAALQTTVTRYLVAYGPASVEDIAKWLGQARLPRIRGALDALGDRVRHLKGDGGRALVDLAELPSPPAEIEAPPRFLSRWDSALIAYDVRERILPAAYRAAVAKPNADFLPTFLVDGFVAGLWSIDRTVGGQALLRLEALGKIGASDRVSLEDEGERLVRYLSPDAQQHGVDWAR